MTLEAWQASYNGLTFGAGQDVGIVSIEGLRGMPDMRINEPPQPRADGSYPALQLMGTRTITLHLDLSSASETDYGDALETVAAAFSPIEDPTVTQPPPLDFLDPVWPGSRTSYCRPVKGGINTDLSYSLGLAIFSVELLADDPVIYDHIVQEIAISSGPSLATNAGNWPALPYFQIESPFDGFTLYVNDNAMIVSSLAESGTFYLDCKTHTFIGSAGVSHYNTLSALPQWFALPPGDTSVALDGSTSGVAMYFSSAWAWV